MKGKFGEWTPCSVGMPDEYDSIFARLKGTAHWKTGMFSKKSEEVIVTVINYDYKYDRFMWQTTTSHTLDGSWAIEKEHAAVGLKSTIIAWMPLPQAYDPDAEERRKNDEANDRRA